MLLDSCSFLILRQMNMATHLDIEQTVTCAFLLSKVFFKKSFNILKPIEILDRNIPEGGIFSLSSDFSKGGFLKLNMPFKIVS